jgi:DeoR/GlpR family transcriptional regulator of sugar metabolism
MHNKRHDDILKLVHLRKQVSVSELTKRLEVSEVTIRKDLAVLEDQGHLVRVRGGAIPAEDAERSRSLYVRRSENVPAKEAVAARALELIHEGETIFLDSGSSCAAVARQLGERDLRVVTNSLEVLYLLADAPSITLYCLGGTFRKEAGSFIGPATTETLERVQIETAFLGTTGLSTDGAFSSQNLLESDVKRRVIAASRRSVVLTDHTKVGVQAFSVFARAADIDLLIIDRVDSTVDALSPLDVEILYAELAEPTAGPVKER